MNIGDTVSTPRGIGQIIGERPVKTGGPYYYVDVEGAGRLMFSARNLKLTASRHSSRVDLDPYPPVSKAMQKKLQERQDQDYLERFRTLDLNPKKPKKWAKFSKDLNGYLGGWHKTQSSAERQKILAASVKKAMTAFGMIQARAAQVIWHKLHQLANVTRDWQTKTLAILDRDWVAEHFKPFKTSRAKEPRARMNPCNDNPTLLLVGNPPGPRIDIATLPGYTSAMRAYRKFHGEAPAGFKVKRIPDGKKEVTRKVVSVVGDAEEIWYNTRGMKSNKAGSTWRHKFGEKSGKKPTWIYDPATKMVSAVGGKYKVTDWFHD